MDWITLWQALLLGVVEGLTEFLPVSSTGHLILLIDMIGFAAPKGRVFEVVIQLGAILAICWCYRQRLFDALTGAPHDPVKRRFLQNILIGFLPAAVIGAVLHDFIKDHFFNAWVVSIMLVVGGIVILLVERYKPEPRYHEVEDFGWKLALKIGFCQALAMIPGTSRSGATIVGALLLRVDRRAATEYSFFLAIPTMLGATAFDLYKNYSDMTQHSLLVIAVGFVGAFIAAMLIVRWAIRFITTHGFVPFAYYRIALGGLMLTLLMTAS